MNQQLVINHTAGGDKGQSHTQFRQMQAFCCSCVGSSAINLLGMSALTHQQGCVSFIMQRLFWPQKGQRRVFTPFGMIALTH
tara:strand:- start:5623 stop:5868 length:246 start_codon:yes stop_codon:yes gene_type:complete